MQVGCVTDAQNAPVAHCGTFSVGNLVLQVFCCEQEDADLSPDNEAWLKPKEQYVPALIPIAPAVESIRWPPEAVFTVNDLELLAARLRHGLPSRA